MRSDLSTTLGDEPDATPDWDRILDILSQRRSCRDFDGTPIDDAVLSEIVRDGTQAPSSCNHQNWHFVIVTDRDLLMRAHDIAGGNHHFAHCAALVYLCFQKGWTHGNFSIVQSVAGACYHMMLSAHLRGFASIWNAGIGDTDAIAEMLNVPPTFQIIGALAIGRPKPTAPAVKAPRRPFSEVHSWNGFQRRAATMYPVKKAESYPFELIKNAENPFALWDPMQWSWEAVGDFRGYAVWAKSPLPGVYVSRRQGDATEVELDLIPAQSPDAVVLEMLPWGGTYTVALRRRLPEGAELRVADLSAHNLTFILERFRQEKLPLDRTVFDLIDGPRIAYADGEVDTVFLPQVLEHMPDPKKMLDEVHRILKPGGTLVLSVRNMDSIYGAHWQWTEARGQIPNQGPFTPLSAASVRATVTARFEIEEEFGIGREASGDAAIARGDDRLRCRLWAARAHKR